jgi:hypothetical protein
MKVRKGFVANSSSSSFVVAFKRSDPCKCCGHHNKDIVSIINDEVAKGIDDYDETRVRTVGVSDVMKDIQGWFMVGTEYANPRSLGMFTSVSAKIADALDDGFEISTISVSYHNTYLNNLLSEETESLKILFYYE